MTYNEIYLEMHLDHESLVYYNLCQILVDQVHFFNHEKSKDVVKLNGTNFHWLVKC